MPEFLHEKGKSTENSFQFFFSLCDTFMNFQIQVDEYFAVSL